MTQLKKRTTVDASNFEIISTSLPITFGSHNISEGKNEDRGTMFLSHKSEGCPQLASFSIFDGHNGNVAASALSQQFNKNVASRFHTMMNYKYMPPNSSTPSSDIEETSIQTLSPQDIKDAYMCESIRLSCIEVDKNIRHSHKSGSTLNSLFLDCDNEDGSIRAYCANVGDSKCVMFTQSPPVVLSLYESEQRQDNSIIPSRIRSLSYCFEKHETNYAYPMSIDHKLDLHRERHRVNNKTTVEWQPLPSDVLRGNYNITHHHAIDQQTIHVDQDFIEVDPPNLSTDILPPPPPSITQSAVTYIMNLTSRDKNEKVVVSKSSPDIDIIHAGYPNEDLKTEAANYITNMVNALASDEARNSNIKVKNVVYKTSEFTGMLSALDLTNHYSNHEEREYREIHKESFVDFRRAGDRIGPEAIFSRYNLSINMTRSIGDKYAARCVIPIPDISVVSIPNDQFSRFILASDGVWDVLEIDEIRKIVFSSKRAEEISLLIAEEARKRRIRRKIRMDDISVIVVDVNLHLFYQPLQCVDCVKGCFPSPSYCCIS